MSTPPPSPIREETEPRFDSRQRAKELFALLPKEAHRQLRWQAQRLEFQLTSPVADRDDHQQDLVLELLKKLPRFDERRAGLRTFASQIIESSASHRKRFHRAKKRVGQTTALSSHLDGGDLRRPTPPVDAARWELASDSQACLNQLSPLQQQVCRYLGDQSEREIASRLGISRHVIRAEIRQIRRCFIRNEMRAYL
jgi:RNA polymerase sigma factor (sigma-70 family)